MGRVMQASQDNPSAEALDAAAEILKNGGVIVSPTDSVYGLVCAATTGNPAHQRIFAIKNRPATQTLPLFVADPEDLLRFAATIPSWAFALAHAYWPGALTLVVTATDALPAEPNAQVDECGSDCKQEHEAQCDGCRVAKLVGQEVWQHRHEQH